MHWYQWNFFGMHFIWWTFWVATCLVFFSWVVPVPRKRMRLYRADPLGVLKRRYAAGEITTAEYEERKARLVADSPNPKPPGGA